MRVRLRWVIGLSLAISVLAWVLMWAMLNLAGHSVDATDYWSSAVSWLVNAAGAGGTLCSVVSISLVLPVVLIWRLGQKGLRRDGAHPPIHPAGPDPEQRRWASP